MDIFYYVSNQAKHFLMSDVLSVGKLSGSGWWIKFSRYYFSLKISVFINFYHWQQTLSVIFPGVTGSLALSSPPNISHTQFRIGCLQSFIQVKYSVLWKEWLVHPISQSLKYFLFETVIPLYFDRQCNFFILYSFHY